MSIQQNMVQMIPVVFAHGGKKTSSEDSDGMETLGMASPPSLWLPKSLWCLASKWWIYLCFLQNWVVFTHLWRMLEMYIYIYMDMLQIPNFNPQFLLIESQSKSWLNPQAALRGSNSMAGHGWFGARAAHGSTPGCGPKVCGALCYRIPSIGLGVKIWAGNHISIL